MKYIINVNDHIPAYIQLYQQLRDDIIGKTYIYGSKLPSKRLIAEETGVSVITVEHAYALLCDEGYIESMERSGYFVIFRVEDGFAVPAKTAGDPLMNHKNNTPSYPFPYSVLAKTAYCHYRYA